MLVKPERLRPGDTVGIVAPSSPPPNPDAIDRSLEALQRLGFKPLLAHNARRRNGFLAGSDRQRAHDLMRMFRNRDVKAIFCVRGGYGISRLLPLLDYELIRANPKILVGYSDITALHCALLKKSRLVSFHGPMLNGDLIKPDLPDFTLTSLLRTLCKAEAPGSVRNHYEEPSIRILRSGTASGRLVGGNLSLLCTMVGTPWQPTFKGRILFLEDLEEAPYRIDRMLTHLLNTGLLQQVAGVAVGINRNCVDPKAKKCNEFRQTVDDVLRERLRPLKVPVVTGLPFGHVRLNATLPVGVRAMLDARKADLVIVEPAVT